MNDQGRYGQSHQILLSRFISSRQWDRALETAREWLSTDPENPQAHFAAGQSLVNLRRCPEAESHVAKGLARDPGNSFAHRLMSMVQFHQRRFTAADRSIHKALSLNPTDPYNWYQLALMTQKQGDLATAKKYAEKARELSPRDPDILNLLAMCAPKNDAGNSLRLRQYQEALELDPENPQVHNNIGVCYLNAGKDYARAEESFRRALFFDPSLKVARSNLFITIKHRDIVYRVLCAPKDFIFECFALARRNRLLYFLALPLWLVAFRFLLAGLALWFPLVWPIVKVYEYLTIGDLRAQAGEPGAKRGGLFGYRRWPLRVRLFIFALLLCLFWGSIAWAVFKGTENVKVFMALAMTCGLLIVLALWVRVKWKQGSFRYRRRRSSKEIDRLLKSQGAQR
jgi:Flp pilus assembly protein TadD